MSCVKNGTNAPRQEHKVPEKAVSKSVLTCRTYVYIDEPEKPLCKIGQEIRIGRQQKCVAVLFIITMDTNTINETTTITDVTSTTTFLETGSREAASYETNTSKGDYALREQALKDFFSKPIGMVYGNWDVTKLEGYDIAAIVPSQQLLSNAMWGEKWSGYRLMRGTAVVRLELNCEPFQQGLLRMWWSPNLNGIQTLSHARNMAGKFMFPGITVDARNSSAELRVPFVAPYDWWDSKNDDFNWGTIYVTVFSPLLVGTGTQNASFSVYLSFEDFELAAPVRPQMEMATLEEPVVLTNCELQMEKSRFSSGLNKEHVALNERPISSALSLAAKAADSLAGIPQLAPAMTPSAWAMRAAAGLASSLGWSKAPNLEPPKVFTNYFDPFMATPDGVCNIPVIGLSADRKVEITDKLTFRDEDEMSFNFLKKQWGYVDKYQWNVSNLVDDSLYLKDLCPDAMKFSDSVAYAGKTALYGVGPPAYYLSKAFSVWRGSIRVRIRFAKTDYHTGRLMVTWTPGSSTFTTPNVGDSSYSMREIVDLSNCSSIELELPYLLADNYVPVNIPSGRLSVKVLNPLRAPGTCEQSIKMIIEMCGGDDFELQVPTAATPLIPFYPQMETGTISENKVVAASRLDECGPYNVERSKFCIGDHFTSVKQILSRNNRILATAAAGAGVAQINPWFSSITTIDIGTGALTGATYGGDIVSYIFCMYGYFRGDARFVFYQTASNNLEVAVKAVATPCAFTTRYSIENGTQYNNVTPSIAWRTISGGVPVSLSSGPCSELILNNKLGTYGCVVPYSSRGYGSRVVIQNSDTVPPNDKSNPLQYLQLTSSQALGNTVTYRSFADNFQLSMYIGCPPVLEGYA